GGSGERQKVQIDIAVARGQFPCAPASWRAQRFGRANIAEAGGGGIVRMLFAGQGIGEECIPAREMRIGKSKAALDLITEPATLGIEIVVGAGGLKTELPGLLGVDIAGVHGL